MSRHLVALVAEYESFDDKGDSFHHGLIVYSGFVLSLHDHWFWVTAGHCIENHDDHDGLDDLITAGRIKLHRVGFADYFGLNAPHRHTIPYSYEPRCAFRAFRKDLGLDFALIPLPVLIRTAFQKNKIIAVSRKNWIHQSEVAFSLYKILGFPSHLVQYSVTSSGELVGGFQPVMFNIDRLSPSDVEDVPADIWFVGCIPPEVTIKDIKGMSGGPIYGFRKSENGQWFYHVVALQSWWRKESRTVFGCSVPIFAEAVRAGAHGRIGGRIHLMFVCRRLREPVSTQGRGASGHIDRVVPTRASEVLRSPHRRAKMPSGKVPSHIDLRQSPPRRIAMDFALRIRRILRRIGVPCECGHDGPARHKLSYDNDLSHGNEEKAAGWLPAAFHSVSCFISTSYDADKSGRLDLNQRPLGPEPSALARLSYAPLATYLAEPVAPHRRASGKALPGAFFAAHPFGCQAFDDSNIITRPKTADNRKCSNPRLTPPASRPRPPDDRQTVLQIKSPSGREPRGPQECTSTRSLLPEPPRPASGGHPNSTPSAGLAASRRVAHPGSHPGRAHRDPNAISTRSRTPAASHPFRLGRGKTARNPTNQPCGLGRQGLTTQAPVTAYRGGNPALPGNGAVAPASFAFACLIRLRLPHSPSTGSIVAYIEPLHRAICPSLP